MRLLAWGLDPGIYWVMNHWVIDRRDWLGFRALLTPSPLGEKAGMRGNRQISLARFVDYDFFTPSPLPSPTRGEGVKGKAKISNNS
jgi:hypothetical protein